MLIKTMVCNGKVRRTLATGVCSLFSVQLPLHPHHPLWVTAGGKTQMIYFWIWIRVLEFCTPGWREAVHEGDGQEGGSKPVKVVSVHLIFSSGFVVIFACRRENAAGTHLSSEDLVSKYRVHQKMSDTDFSRQMKQAQNSDSETPLKTQLRTSRMDYRLKSL